MMFETATHSALLVAACTSLGVACTSAVFDPENSPFSQAETRRALAPAAQIERTCYEGSVSQKANRRVRFEYIAYVNERGLVHADPLVMDPHDPALSACLQTRLETLRFPAKGETDQFHLRFELKP